MKFERCLQPFWRPEYETEKISKNLGSPIHINTYTTINKIHGNTIRSYYFTLMASIPDKRDFDSWSRKMMKGLPYSSNATVPTADILNLN